MSSLSSSEARRLSLASLGFADRRPKQAGIAHVRSTANRLGAIQVDSVNVLARAHYLPTFSRHGPYPMAILDDLAHTKRELFEYWGHAACLLPMDIYPLMCWRMENQIENWSGIDAKRQAYIEAVFQEIAERGPIAAGDISIGGKSTGPWWGWSDGRQAVEFLFRQGRVALAGRKNFERLYDLSERVRMRGWQIASYPLPANRQETVVQRILVRHGVTGDMACLLIDDIKRAVKHLEKNPVHHSDAKGRHDHSGR